MAVKPIGWLGILLRFFFAVVLVFSTYNPAEYSYYHWFKDMLPEINPLVSFTGVVLLIGWIFCIKVTFDALGWLGVILGAALFAAVIWLLLDIGWISMDSSGILTWLTLVVISLILAVGMAWSHVKRRITGQINVDDVDD